MLEDLVYGQISGMPATQTARATPLTIRRTATVVDINIHRASGVELTNGIDATT